jgi:hypothetical protein
VGEHINEFTAAPVSTCWHTPGPKMSVPPSPSTKAQLLFTKYVTQCELLPPSTPPIWERATESVHGCGVGVRKCSCAPHHKRMPARELVAAAVALDGVADGAIAGGAAERDDRVSVCGESEGRSQQKRSEEGVEVHCLLSMYRCGLR